MQKLSRMVKGATLALAVLAASCAHSPRLSLSTSLRLEADTHLLDLSHIDATEDDWIVRVLLKDGACSGALVAPGVVLTAQHCVVAHGDARVKLPPGDMRVELGGDYLPWGRVGVVGVVACPCWKGDATGDVAALVLEVPLPPEVPTRPVRVVGEPRVDEDIFAGGFGTRDGSKAIPLTSWSARTIARNHRSGVTTDVMAGALVMSGLARPGDSGGPVWSRDTGEILGVVSRGTEGGTGNGAPARARERAEGGERVLYVIAARVDTCAGVVARATAMAERQPEGRWPVPVCR